VAVSEERRRLDETAERNQKALDSARQTLRELDKAGKTSEQVANRARKGLHRLMNRKGLA